MRKHKFGTKREDVYRQEWRGVDIDWECDRLRGLQDLEGEREIEKWEVRKRGRKERLKEREKREFEKEKKD